MQNIDVTYKLNIGLKLNYYLSAAKTPHFRTFEKNQIINTLFEEWMQLTFQVCLVLKRLLFLIPYFLITVLYRFNTLFNLFTCYWFVAHISIIILFTIFFNHAHLLLLLFFSYYQKQNTARNIVAKIGDIQEVSLMECMDV